MLPNPGKGKRDLEATESNSKNGGVNVKTTSRTISEDSEIAAVSDSFYN